MAAPGNADQLADLLLSAGSIKSPAVDAAFRAVPRHLFIPEIAAEDAYRDEAIPTKMIGGQAVSSASQPAVVAVMLEQLEVAPGQRVLEVGAGTGYNAALLAHLVGPSGRVVTVDIDADIADSARAHLATAGVDGVEVVWGDGGLGHAAAAPYDRIVLTVGAWDIAPAWWDQLAPAGRLLVPLSLRGVQRCVALERRDGWLESVSVCDCGFMRLRGGFRGPETIVTAGSLTVTFDSEVDAAGLPELLTRAAGQRRVDATISVKDMFGGLALWLALHDPGYCTLHAVWRTDENPPIPVVATHPSGQTMVGWSPASYQRSSLAVLGRGPRGVTIHEFGENTERAERLAALVAEWDAAGRPNSHTLTMRIHRAGEPTHDRAGLIKVPKRWTTILVEWPGTRT